MHSITLNLYEIQSVAMMDHFIRLFSRSIMSVLGGVMHCHANYFNLHLVVCSAALLMYWTCIAEAYACETKTADKAGCKISKHH